MQFYWNTGDLGAFSSSWLADWEHFRSIGDMFGRYFFFYVAKFCFLHISNLPNFFFFLFLNSTRIRVFNFRQILEGKLYPWLIYIWIDLCMEIYGFFAIEQWDISHSWCNVIYCALVKLYLNSIFYVIFPVSFVTYPTRIRNNSRECGIPGISEKI